MDAGTLRPYVFQQPGKLRQVDDFTMKGEATDPTAAHSLEGDSCCLQRATPAKLAWWRSGPHTYIRKTVVSGSNGFVLLHSLLQDSLQAPSSLGQKVSLSRSRLTMSQPARFPDEMQPGGNASPQRCVWK